jgi:hypothetical protein
MDRTLKWTLGGIGGCLGLILLVIVGVIVWLLVKPDDHDGEDVLDDSIPIYGSDEPTEDVGSSFTLMGRVVDGATGMPVDGAQITFLGPSGVPLITYTDASGSYSAGLDDVGAYVLTVTAAGYLTGFYPNAFERTSDMVGTNELEDITLDPQ